jgi:hypothetical protein
VVLREMFDGSHDVSSPKTGHLLALTGIERIRQDQHGVALGAQQMWTALDFD